MPQRTRKKILLSASLLALASTFLLTHRPHMSANEACHALTEQYQRKRDSQERDKITYYYQLKEYEVNDEDAWRAAVERVERELVALSNAVANCHSPN